MKGLCRVGQGQSECQWGRCLLVCRMENLFINRFMHMFQSSWSDFADFEKIFVKISNTISGECTHPFPGVSHGAGEICLGPGKGRPTPAPTWQLAPPHQPGLHPCHSPRSFPVVPLPPRAFPSLGTQGYAPSTSLCHQRSQKFQTLYLRESVIYGISEQSKSRT